MRFLVLFFSILCISSNALAADEFYRRGNYRQGVRYRYQGDYDRYQSGSTMRYPSEIQVRAPNPDKDYVNNGFYLGLRGGVGIYTVEDDGTNGYDISKNKQMFSLAMGGRYNHFRLEAEYVNRAGIAIKNNNYKHKFRNDSFLGHFYVDLLPYFVVTPYLSAGAGFTKVYYKGTGAAGREKENKYVFTSAFGGGVSLRASDSSNFDIGYKYNMLSSLDNYKDVDLYHHDIYIGFRHVF